MAAEAMASDLQHVPEVGAGPQPLERHEQVEGEGGVVAEHRQPRTVSNDWPWASSQIAWSWMPRSKSIVR